MSASHSSLGETVRPAACRLAVGAALASLLSVVAGAIATAWNLATALALGAAWLGGVHPPSIGGMEQFPSPASLALSWLGQSSWAPSSLTLGECAAQAAASFGEACVCAAPSAADFPAYELRVTGSHVIAFLCGMALGPLVDVLRLVRLRWHRLVWLLERRWQARPPATP